MRGHGIFMIFRLSTAYGSSMETVAHAIVLLDRMLAKGASAINASIGCFMIATKMLETRHPSLQDLADLAFCSVEQVRTAEIGVLQALDWDVHVETKDWSQDTAAWVAASAL